MYSEGRAQIQEVFIWKGDRKVRAMGLCSQWIMTYGHGLSDMDLRDGDKLHVDYNGVKHEITFDQDLIRSVPSQDLAFMWLDTRAMPRFKDITNRFLDMEEWNGLDDALCIMNTMSVAGRRVKVAKNTMYNVNSGLTSITYGVLSNFPTTNGDCGRPLEVLTGRLSGRIVGLHVAGSLEASDKVSLCSFIDRGTVMSVTKNLIAQDNIDKIELINKVDRIHMSTSSKLVPSLIHGKMSRLPAKQPAILCTDDIRSAGQDPVENFMDDIDVYHDCNIDDVILDEIFNTMGDNYELALEYPYGKRELSFEEACKGLPGHLASIYTKSS